MKPKRKVMCRRQVKQSSQFGSVCAADLWDVVLEELRVWFSIIDGRGGEQGVVIDSGRIQLPTGTARDDTCSLSCQVNGT